MDYSKVTQGFVLTTRVQWWTTILTIAYDFFFMPVYTFTFSAKEVEFLKVEASKGLPEGNPQYNFFLIKKANG